MARDLRLSLRITAKTREALNALARLGTRLGAVGGGASKAFSALNATLGATTGALTSIKGLAIGFGVFAGLRGIVGATVKQEEALAQIEARLRSTGRTSQITTAQIAAIASQLQEATGIGDEVILDAQAKLLSFTNVAVDQLPRSTEVILDIASAMGSDLSSAAIQLGKALDDPKRGLDGLSRAGTTFSEEQKEAIRTLHEQGRVAEAQALILAGVEAQTGGTARALRDSLGGALKAAGSAFGDLFERADEGGALRSAVERLVTLLSDPNTKQGVQAFTTLLIDGLATAASLVTDISNGLRHLFGDSTPEQDLAELVDLRDDGFLSRLRIGGDEGIFAHLSDEDIDRMLNDRLRAIEEAGRTISRSLAAAIRQSGAEVDEALLERVTEPAAEAAKAIKALTDQAGDISLPGLAPAGDTGATLDDVETARRNAEAVAALVEKLGVDAEKLEALAASHAALSARLTGSLESASEAAEAAAAHSRAATVSAAEAMAAAMERYAERASAAYGRVAEAAGFAAPHEVAAAPGGGGDDRQALADEIARELDTPDDMWAQLREIVAASAETGQALADEIARALDAPDDMWAQLREIVGGGDDDRQGLAESYAALPARLAGALESAGDAAEDSAARSRAATESAAEAMAAAIEGYAERASTAYGRVAEAAGFAVPKEVAAAPGGGDRRRALADEIAYQIDAPQDMRAHIHEIVAASAEAGRALADEIAYQIDADDDTLARLREIVADSAGTGTAEGGVAAGRVPTIFGAGAEPQRVIVGGEVRIGFDGAPPGMRVLDVHSDNPDVDIDVSAGYAMAGT